MRLCLFLSILCLDAYAMQSTLVPLKEKKSLPEFTVSNNTDMPINIQAVFSCQAQCICLLEGLFPCGKPTGIFMGTQNMKDYPIELHPEAYTVIGNPRSQKLKNCALSLIALRISAQGKKGITVTLKPKRESQIKPCPVSLEDLRDPRPSTLYKISLKKGNIQVE